MSKTEALTENSLLIGVKQVAELLGMQPTTIYVWAQQGKLPAIKMGRTWRFRKSSIIKWLDKCESEGELPDSEEE